MLSAADKKSSLFMLVAAILRIWDCNCASSQSVFLQTKQPQETGLRKEVSIERQKTMLTHPSSNYHAVLFPRILF